MNIILTKELAGRHWSRSGTLGCAGVSLTWVIVRAVAGGYSFRVACAKFIWFEFRVARIFATQEECFQSKPPVTEEDHIFRPAFIPTSCRWGQCLHRQAQFVFSVAQSVLFCGEPRGRLCPILGDVTCVCVEGLPANIQRATQFIVPPLVLRAPP
ncbi:hypothetical protein MRX96_027363 [Rhipicephalus microplus]